MESTRNVDVQTIIMNGQPTNLIVWIIPISGQSRKYFFRTIQVILEPTRHLMRGCLHRVPPTDCLANIFDAGTVVTHVSDCNSKPIVPETGEGSSKGSKVAPGVSVCRPNSRTCSAADCPPRDGRHRHTTGCVQSSFEL